MKENILKVNNLTKRFGGFTAVDDLSFTVSKNEVLGVIGPNGAGKSTTFNLITGVYQPDEGQVEIDGQNVVGYSPNKICNLGLSRTFQVTRPFGDMTVLENVTTGAFLKTRSLKKAKKKAQEMIEFVVLSGKENFVAKNLSIIDQRRLEFARALATEPSILLLDEVLAGLNAQEVDEAIELIVKVRNAGPTLIVIEHVMKVITAISDRILVLNFGSKLAEGQSNEVLKDPKVVEAYLGKGFDLNHA